MRGERNEKNSYFNIFPVFFIGRNIFFRIFCVYDEASAGKTRHYVLTIYRIKKDECKAIVRNGLEIKYDLKRDLDLPDIFTYTLTNGIGASPY